MLYCWDSCSTEGESGSSFGGVGESCVVVAGFEGGGDAALGAIGEFFVSSFTGTSAWSGGAEYSASSLP